MSYSIYLRGTISLVKQQRQLLLLLLLLLLPLSLLLLLLTWLRLSWLFFYTDYYCGYYYDYRIAITTATATVIIKVIAITTAATDACAPPTPANHACLNVHDSKDLRVMCEARKRCREILQHVSCIAWPLNPTLPALLVLVAVVVVVVSAAIICFSFRCCW